MRNLKKQNKKITELMNTENRLVAAWGRGRGWRGWVIQVKRAGRTNFQL